MKNIVIIGAGRHSKVVADIILQRKKISENLDVVGFIADGFENLGYSDIFGIPILGDIETIKKFKEMDYEYIIAIGSNIGREKVSERLGDIKYYTAIHPRANMGENVDIGKGCMIMANAVVNSYSKIGDHVIINTGSIVEHDNFIGDYVHIAPGAVLCGGVTVENKAQISAGSIVILDVKVGENATVGAGATVIRNVEKNCIVVGNPAKILRKI